MCEFDEWKPEVGRGIEPVLASCEDTRAVEQAKVSARAVMIGDWRGRGRTMVRANNGEGERWRVVET